MFRSYLKLTVFAAVAALAMQLPAVVNAAEWGSIKGRIVVDGEAPKAAPLAVDNKDPFCLTAKPVNQSIVVGKDNALENAVVYVKVGAGQKIEINPEYEAEFKKPVVLDNSGCAFHPHITLVRKGQALTIKNDDPTGHNTNIAMFAFNQTVPAKGQLDIKASVAQSIPNPVVCNIHSFMKGHILSLEHPYMAVSGPDGTFEIKNIPVGTHEFQFWHEVPGYLKNVKMKAGATDARGRAKLKIAAGETLDLGDIKVPASALK